MTTAASQHLYDVIALRRDVRAEFSGGHLDDTVLHRILGAAHAAPGIGHSQAWDFVMVCDEATRTAFHMAAERATYAASLPLDRAAAFGRHRRPLTEAVHHERYGAREVR